MHGLAGGMGCGFENGLRHGTDLRHYPKIKNLPLLPEARRESSPAHHPPRPLSWVLPWGPGCSPTQASGPVALAQAPAGSRARPPCPPSHPAPAGLGRSQASYSIPDVTLVDQEGRPVALRDLLSTDKPILANFIFTTCTAICPAMSATFQQVQQGLAGDRERS